MHRREFEEEFASEDVRQAFLDFPLEISPKLMALRNLILETAANIEGVGPIEETLKWGQPAYLTSQSKSGSTIRLGWKDAAEPQYAMYFICNTNLVERFRLMFPEGLHFEGNRAIVFNQGDTLPIEKLSECIAAALTYHRDKA
ncbi:MAG: DUF1801 domain-containing protein [Chloroflexota bacterium]